MTEEEKKRREQAEAVNAIPALTRPQTPGEVQSAEYGRQQYLNSVAPDVTPNPNAMYIGKEETLPAPSSVQTPASKIAAMQRILPQAQAQGVFDSVFGPELTPTEQAEAARNQTLQDMFDKRRTALEQSQTDSARLAQYNALGKILTSLVQPLGWAAGGGKGVTAGVQPYDDRQYLQAFERAVKASDDLRNIGALEDEFKYKQADEEYKRLVALEAAEAEQKRAVETYKQKSAIDTAAKLELYDNKYEHEKDLARLKNMYKITTRKGSLSVEDRVLLKAIDEYNKERIASISQGNSFPTLDEWLKENKGYNLNPKEQKPADNSDPNDWGLS